MPFLAGMRRVGWLIWALPFLFLGHRRFGGTSFTLIVLRINRAHLGLVFVRFFLATVSWSFRLLILSGLTWEHLPKAFILPFGNTFDKDCSFWQRHKWGIIWENRILVVAHCTVYCNDCDNHYLLYFMGGPINFVFLLPFTFIMISHFLTSSLIMFSPQDIKQFYKIVFGVFLESSTVLKTGSSSSSYNDDELAKWITE